MRTGTTSVHLYRSSETGGEPERSHQPLMNWLVLNPLPEPANDRPWPSSHHNGRIIAGSHDRPRVLSSADPNPCALGADSSATSSNGSLGPAPFPRVTGRAHPEHALEVPREVGLVVEAHLGGDRT